MAIAVAYFRTTRLLLIAAALLAGWLSSSAVPADDEQHDNKPRDYERYALSNAGDPERGRTLFRDAKRTRCNACHKIENDGGDVGPPLTAIGGKFDRPHLIESVLEPSRQIVEGFRATVVQTNDGRTLSGIVRQESDTELILIDGKAERQTIAKSDIAERAASPVSLMPAGLADQLSPEEFADLIAYLERLRTGPADFGAGVSGPIRLPPGFSVRTIATGISGATASRRPATGGSSSANRPAPCE